MIQALNELVSLIHWIHAQGWSPATSTNYSMRNSDYDQQAYVSSSGVDKSNFALEHFILMDLNAEQLEGYQHLKPSAETAVHLMLYQQTDCKVVVHTHSKSDTLLSRLSIEDKQLILKDYELLKGLRDIESHTEQTIVPIFKNTQDIQALSIEMSAYLSQHSDCQGLLIESHGFYTWGRSVSEAKRHLEVFQFLLDCELEILKFKEC